MALDIQNFRRKFFFKKNGKEIDLVDPNRDMSPQEVIAFHSGQHPELTTCTIDGPRPDGDTMVYEFKTTVGTKG